MSTFTELYGVNQRAALQFFFSGLNDLIPEREKPAQKETLYVASILAHYAQTSRYESESMPVLAGLGEVFDCFVLIPAPSDSEILETAGAQSLLFAGFFGNQMRQRHDLDYYDFVGSSFYERARHHTNDTNKKVLFWLMASHFSRWTGYCRVLNRTFQENQFLLNIHKNKEP